MRMSMKLVLAVLFAGFCLASSDIFLSFGGLRLSSVCMGLVVLAALVSLAQQGTIRWPVGMTALMLWCLVQFVLAWGAKPLDRSLIYVCWLFLSALFVTAVVQLYGRASMKVLRPVMTAYIWSFLILGGFAIVQFVGPALHLPPMFVRQWMWYGHIPRINGLSYEPSYFAIYMLMGWIILLDLRLSGSELMRGRGKKIALWLVLTSLILSTSRTGWIFVALEGLLRLWPRIRRGLRAGAHRLQTTNLRWSFLFLRRRFIYIVLTVAVTAGSFWLIFVEIGPRYLLNGTGLYGTATHSYDYRADTLRDTMDMMQEHPWIGPSIGGLAGEYAQKKGISDPTYEDTKHFEGLSVFLEAIVGSGWIGVLPFFVFFYYISFWPRRLVKQHWPDERAKWLRALLRALLFEWALLAFNDNILRTYLWFTIAMVSLLSYQLRYNSGRHEVASPAILPVPNGFTAELGSAG